jgi:hypothetical protein
MNPRSYSTVPRTLRARPDERLQHWTYGFLVGALCGALAVLTVLA